MWTMLGSMALGLAKWVFSMKAKKKLEDKEFLEHVLVHQKRMKNTGKSTLDFEDALAEARKELEAGSK